MGTAIENVKEEAADFGNRQILCYAH